MNTKGKISKLPACFCLIFLVLICGNQVFAQAPAASIPLQNAKPADPAAALWELLTPYQKSQVERMYTDWGFLAKYREANKQLPAPAPNERRVVFLGDSITEGWGMKGPAGAPDRGEYLPGRPYINRGISG